MKNVMTKILWTLPMVVIANPVLAQEGTEAVAQAANTGLGAGLRGIGAALAISIAALGGALGQGRAAAMAFDGIARNPAAKDKINTPFILSLVLIESLVIYALIVALRLA